MHVLQPEQLKEVIDFGIPEDPLNLDQLLVDCKDTLKYQVKTGRREQLSIIVSSIMANISFLDYCLWGGIRE